MRGCADHGGPVVGDRREDRERVLKVSRSVVEPRQDVGVEVDHG
jgi:hypothetical protein